MHRIVALGLLSGLLLTGCTSTPSRDLAFPAAGIRVVSFAMERGVRVGSLNGPLETFPGFLNDGEAFDRPLVATIEGLWGVFPGQATLELGGRWMAPGEADAHPNWVAASSEPISRASVDWSRARGFLWPDGLRFLDSSTDALGNVSNDYPGQWLLTVEYTLFSDDVGLETEFRYPEFRVGISGRFSLFGTDGKVLERAELVGYSADTAPRRGASIDRSRYADLAIQAQADLLRKWGQKVRFVFD